MTECICNAIDGPLQCIQFVFQVFLFKILKLLPPLKVFVYEYRCCEQWRTFIPATRLFLIAFRAVGCQPDITITCVTDDGHQPKVLSMHREEQAISCSKKRLNKENLIHVSIWFYF